MSILDEINKYIIEAEDNPVAASDVENVADAPVKTDDTIEIGFSDLKEEVQKNVKDLLMKEMNATDEFSLKNVESKLNTYSIFHGSVKQFKNQLGLENK